MELSPERIYLEAVRAAGPAEEISDWRVKVDQIAGEILAGIKAFTKRMLVVQHSITLAGIVQDVVENPVSENNRALNLYKVVFKADSGSRPDQMWIDKNDPAGAALFAQAKALVGKRSRIVKEQRARFAGDDMVMKDGKPETSPYLASIKTEEEGAEPAPAAKATDDGKKLSPKLRGSAHDRADVRPARSRARQPALRHDADRRKEKRRIGDRQGRTGQEALGRRPRQSVEGDRLPKRSGRSGLTNPTIETTRTEGT